MRNQGQRETRKESSVQTGDSTQAMTASARKATVSGSSSLSYNNKKRNHKRRNAETPSHIIRRRRTDVGFDEFQHRGDDRIQVFKAVVGFAIFVRFALKTKYLR
jgi:hypothetical protein